MPSNHLILSSPSPPALSLPGASSTCSNTLGADWTWNTHSCEGTWEEPPPVQSAPTPQGKQAPSSRWDPTVGAALPGWEPSLQGLDPQRGFEDILTVTLGPSGQRAGHEDVLSVTMGSSGRWTGYEDDLTAWPSAGCCPSLRSLDPREGVNKTLIPGLQCMIPTTPRPVISEHIEQQMIKSSTEVSSTPTLSGPGPSSDQAVCVSSVGGCGSPGHVHICGPTCFCRWPYRWAIGDYSPRELVPHPSPIPICSSWSEVHLPKCLVHPYPLILARGQQNRVDKQWGGSKGWWGEFSMWPPALSVRKSCPSVIAGED